MIRKLIEFYGEDKGGRTAEIAQNADFIGRLRHAASGRFGVIVELIQDSVRQALRLGDSSLLIEHFAAVYAARTGCIRDENVFTVVADWEEIDTSGLWDADDLPPEKQPRKAKNKSNQKGGSK
jgi:hypothetical protein